MSNKNEQQLFGDDKGSLERKIKTSGGFKNNDILLNDKNSFDFSQQKS